MKEHFTKEGLLHVEDAIAICQKAAAVLKKEPAWGFFLEEFPVDHTQLVPLHAFFSVLVVSEC